jgi:hypothetical protein
MNLTSLENGAIESVPSLNHHCQEKLRPREATNKSITEGISNDKIKTTAYKGQIITC